MKTLPLRARVLAAFIRGVGKLFFRTRVEGLELIPKKERVVVIANHQSFIDVALVAAYFGRPAVFPADTFICQKWWVKLIAKLKLAELFPMNSENPFAFRQLVRYLQEHEDMSAIVFPEGRITTTGGLMKVYDGAGWIADKLELKLLPMRIEGAQFTIFSRLGGVVKRRPFPKITLTVTPLEKLRVDKDLRGRAKRKAVGRKLQRLMVELMFSTTPLNKTIPEAIDEAGKNYGWRLPMLSGHDRMPFSYRKLKTAAHVFAPFITELAPKDKCIPVMMPTVPAGAVALFGVLSAGKTPAMLNFTAGRRALEDALEMTEASVLLTARGFIEKAKLEELIEELGKKVKIVYLEDIKEKVHLGHKLKGLYKAYKPWQTGHKPTDPAVVLFTSGSEGRPKGVVLSHKNVIANAHQIAKSIHLGPQDKMLNALPIFHSFGFTGGLMLPLLQGTPALLYPSPLHYRIVPEVAYNYNATLMFGTDTFMSRYARFAHPYDFYKVRVAFVGAEKLKPETKRQWSDRFGVRLLEGYGCTETSPAVAVNTLRDPMPGSVGAPVPGMEITLRDKEGVDEGGQLLVRGPNVMLGYLKADHPGQIKFPTEDEGEGWYDTGDIVKVNDLGGLEIIGRAKRFAKVAGEMVSLAAVEQFVEEVWPDAHHAVGTRPDGMKGERLVLVTQKSKAERSDLIKAAKDKGISALMVPQTVVDDTKLPLLGAGKVDYPALQKLIDDID